MGAAQTAECESGTTWSCDRVVDARPNSEDRALCPPNAGNWHSEISPAGDETPMWVTVVEGHLHHTQLHVWKPNPNIPPSASRSSPPLRQKFPLPALPASKLNYQPSLSVTNCFSHDSDALLHVHPVEAGCFIYLSGSLLILLISWNPIHPALKL